MKIRVVNLRTEACDIRIDRRTPFGNPFRIKRGRSREDVIDEFRWLWPGQRMRQTWLLERVKALMAQGRKVIRLGCWCKPQRCHGDILAAWLERELESS